MFVLTKRSAALAALASFVIWAAGPVGAGPPEDTAPTRVKPRAVSTLQGVQQRHAQYYNPWEQRSLAFSSDGKTLATMAGAQLQFFDVATGKDLGAVGALNRMGGPAAMAFSPDGKLLVTANGGNYGNQGCGVDLWDVQQHKHLRNLDEDVNVTPFASACFSPDGKTLALAGTDVRRGGAPTIHLWDAASGDEIRRIEGLVAVEPPKGRRVQMPAGIDCLCYSPDGKSLAVVSKQKVLLCEVATGKERCVVGEMLPSFASEMMRGGVMPATARSAAFSHDGRLLAVADSGGMVNIWDLTTGTELMPLGTGKGDVEAVQFSSDGKSLLTLSRESQVLSWPVAGLRRGGASVRDDLPADILSDAWDDLRGEDRPALLEAVRTLASVPRQTMPFLRERLKPVPAVASTSVTQLVADLSKEDFNERKKAAVELRKLGELALPALQEAIEKNYDPIVQGFATKMFSQYPTREQIRKLYAVHVLERIGSDDARKLLDELAKGASESMLTRQAKAASERLAKAPSGTTPETNLETLWANLSSYDSRLAYDAIRALAAHGKGAAPFLAQQLKPLIAFDDDPARLDRLIAELDNNEFAVRDAATKELARMGKVAETALRKAGKTPPSLEAKGRIEELLQAMAKQTLPADRLQAERAIEALEKAGTQEARQALEGMSKEAKNRWMKDAVAEVLKRMGQ